MNGLTSRRIRASLRRWLLVGAFGAAMVGRRAESASTVFAFDDGTMPYRLHLALTMVPMTKYAGNPVLRHGPPGSPDEYRAQFYGSVLRINGKFRMWYMAMANGRHRTATAPEQNHSWPAYAESDDGIHWTKTTLGLVDYHGSTGNNLLAFSPRPNFDRTQPLSLFVLYEPGEKDPSRRYKMALYGRYQATYDHFGVPFHKATIYPYFSPDGLHWTLANSTPPDGVYNDSDVTFAPDTLFELGGLYEFAGIYHVAGHQDGGTILLATGEEGARTMVTHYSTDFIHWSHDYCVSFVRYGYRSKHDLNEAHEPAAVWSRHNVLLGFYGEWQGASSRQDARMPLGFLISNDGVHFREPRPDFAMIAAGGDGDWDRHGLLHGQGFANVGEETYVYYGTWDFSVYDNHNILMPGAADPAGGVGLAKIRRDGFGYLTVHGAGEATCTTVALAFPSGSAGILVNAEGLGPEAKLRVDLLDAAGAPLPGYSGGKGAWVERSGLAVAVRWPAPFPPGAGAHGLQFHFLGAQRSQIRFYAAYIP
jgi:hypothetical protein